MLEKVPLTNFGYPNYVVPRFTLYIKINNYRIYCGIELHFFMFKIFLCPDFISRAKISNFYQ